MTRASLRLVFLALFTWSMASVSKADVMLRVVSHLPGKVGIQTLKADLLAKGAHDIKKALPPARYMDIAKSAIERELGDDSAFATSVVYKAIGVGTNERTIWVVVVKGGTWKASRPGSNVEVLMLLDGTVVPWEWQEEKDAPKKNG